MFDGIAELANGGYSAVLPPPTIERRPEAAVRQLRQLAGRAVDALCHPTLEPLSRNQLGVDDYLINPVAPEELQQMFGAAPLRLTAMIRFPRWIRDQASSRVPHASGHPGRQHPARCDVAISSRRPPPPRSIRLNALIGRR